MNLFSWTGASPVADWLIRTTWQSAALAGIVLLLQLTLGRRLSPAWRHVMWLMVLVRLAVPPQFSIDVFPAAQPRLATNTAAAASTGDLGAVRIRTEVYPLDSQRSEIVPPAVADSIQPKMERPDGWRAVIRIWITIAGGLVAWTILQHLRFVIALSNERVEPSAVTEAAMERVRRMAADRIRVRVTRLVKTPAVFGVMRPVILLPVTCAESLRDFELRMVLLHERTHIRRLDTLIEFLSRLICAVHWFNPIAWLAANRVRMERESVCDEAVLRQTPADARTDYGHLLLNFAERKTTFAIPAVRMASSSKHLRRRITQISTFDPSRLKFANRLIAAALTLAVAVIAVTDARSADPAPAKPLGVANLRATAESKTDDARRRLDERIPEFELQNSLIESAFEKFEQASKTSLFVNWKALEQAGVFRDATISVRVRNMTYGKLLSTMISSLDAKQPLGWYIDEGTVTVTHADEIARADLSTRTYDIRDLLVIVPDFDLPKATGEDSQTIELKARLSVLDLNLETDRRTLGANNENVRRLQVQRDVTALALRRHEDEARAATSQPASPTRQQMVDQIVSLLQETIAPESWRSAGGNIGSIRELGGQLIITHTSEVHRQVTALLAKLREQRSVQIWIESRFVLIDPAKLPQGTWRSRIEQATADADGKAAPASWYLSPEQAADLIGQVKAMPDADLSSPRLMIFNGQRAAVVVSTTHSYVASWRRTVTDGKDAWEPVIDQVESGVRMGLTGTCSADRKSVTLTVQPQISALLRIDSEPFKPDGVKPSSPDYKMIIQRPVLRQQSMQTTVNVPDGQTIALCGLAVPPEIDLSSDKAKPGAAGASRVMLMLVNPSVVGQREVEPAIRQPDNGQN